ncbi:UDP-GlcNAc:betaGal beta-1,3-N-acetylglucosaminyltransferase 7 [Rhineura floridana]|uniref:UDP-GlcNAc:betaGal beta-1,3-N-acetylglucosaminyltransferase 7 n=1 Tax=Rhineura floridana TaxID=261503 RepID=UPI002AC87ADE|nr:UDP-GlcNAc:betaGal beta-1,3-N-acetylglucosaminyltransferase 7 [Rhineura floridana]
MGVSRKQSMKETALPSCLSLSNWSEVAVTGQERDLWNLVDRKKTLYKSVLLSFVLVVTVAVLQRGMAPNQFFQGQQQKERLAEESVNAQKRDRVISDANHFWKKQSVVTKASEAAEKPEKSWDVTTINCTANQNFSKDNWFKGLEPNFRQFMLYRHCRYFPILINHPEKCSGDIYLLIVVKSIITQHDRREAIRRTWGQEKEMDGQKIRTLFLLGVASKEEERANYQKLLDYENRIYGDILQWDFLDSFFNLTLKEVHFLKWFNTYCDNVQYIFKGDDDVFVSPDNIVEFLQDQKPGDLFVGDVLFKARPIRKKENKYYIPAALYNKNTYPPYAGGGGFVMNGPLAKKLHKVSETLELYPIDDVFLGMCLEVLKVTPVAHGGFKTFGIVRNKNSKMNKDPCFYQNMLVVHKLLPLELLTMWDLVRSNLTCSRKLQIL